MPIFLLKHWPKLLAGLVVLAVVATAYFAVQRYNAVIEENANLDRKLVEATANLSAVLNAQQIINRVVDSNADTTVRIVQQTAKTKEAINALPVTTDCVSSPSVGYVLDKLREQTATAPDSPNPVP